MEAAGGVGGSSVVDSEAWPEALPSGRQPQPLTIRPPSILESGATCKQCLTCTHAALCYGIQLYAQQE